jgi:hypothetical protein
VAKAFGWLKRKAELPSSGLVTQTQLETTALAVGQPPSLNKDLPPDAADAPDAPNSREEPDASEEYGQAEQTKHSTLVLDPQMRILHRKNSNLGSHRDKLRDSMESVTQ